jgi:septal ring-binding cell division protein DamX
MRQLKERITHSFRLEPLVRSDIDSYVDFRMRAAGYRGPKLFGPQAMKIIARTSEGLTRRINILADKTLLAAFADGQHEVTAKHARAAVRDSEFAQGRGVSARWWLIGAGVAAGLLAGAAIHFYSVNRAGAPAAGPASSGPQVVEPPSAPRAGREPDPPALPVRPLAPGDAMAASTGTPAAVADRAATVSEPRPEPAATAPAPGAPATSATPAGAPSPNISLAAAPPAAALPRAVDAPKVPPSAPPGPTPPTAGKLTQERFAATQQWLRTAPSGHYTIQLLTVNAGDVAVMERFLRQATDLVELNDLRVYSVKLGGQQHYAATYGLYPSLEETITAMGDLPSTFKARGPYHRSVTLMRRQNQE